MSDGSEPLIVRGTPRIVRASGGSAPVHRAARPQPVAPAPPKPQHGAGTELTAMTAAIGIPACQRCKDLAQKMDLHGTAWCREHREEIIAEMRARARNQSWTVKLTALAKGAVEIAKGNLPLVADWSDPIPTLVDEAIRRAEEKYPPPPTGPIRRNLLYHVYPVRNRWWRWNVEQLLGRISLFNGRRVVACMTAPHLDPPGLVREAFGGELRDEDFLVLPNNPKLREVVSFEPLFSRVESSDPNEATFYAHAKGVTRPSDGEACHDWALLLYEAMLDYWPVVEGILRQYPLAGCFKKVGRYFLPSSQSDWHYSGSFVWYRHRDLFARDWRQIDRFRFGIEPWPSLLFSAAEAGCVFWEGRGFSVYDWAFLHETVWPAFEQWKKEHAHERTASLV